MILVVAGSPTQREVKIAFIYIPDLFDGGRTVSPALSSFCRENPCGCPGLPGLEGFRPFPPMRSTGENDEKTIDILRNRHSGSGAHSRRTERCRYRTSEHDFGLRRTRSGGYRHRPSRYAGRRRQQPIRVRPLPPPRGRPGACGRQPLLLALQHLVGPCNHLRGRPRHDRRRDRGGAAPSNERHPPAGGVCRDRRRAELRER